MSQASEMLVMELRSMVGEMGKDTYSDDYLRFKLEKHALVDRNGREPLVYDRQYVNIDTPPNPIPNPYWEPTYDPHAAAAEIWDEKAAAVAHEFDYSDAGLSAQRTQRYDHFLAQARYHRSRRSINTIRVQPFSSASEDSLLQREKANYG